MEIPAHAVQVLSLGYGLSRGTMLRKFQRQASMEIPEARESRSYGDTLAAEIPWALGCNCFGESIAMGIPALCESDIAGISIAMEIP